MQPTVYFLNRMGELQHVKRQRAGLWANTGYRAEQRPRMENTRRVMNKSRSPLDLPLNAPRLWHGAFSSDSTEMSRRCGEFRLHARGHIYCICMWAVLCMSVNTSQACGSHTRHLHSSSRDPCNNHKSHPHPPPSQASMVSVCQVILLPVQIMTVIKQLRPTRGRGQEQAFFTQSNRRQMRITREYRHYDYGICLLPLVLIAIVGVKRMAEIMQDHIFSQI